MTERAAKRENLYWSGALGMLPITTGVFPFGLVMGVVCADAGLSLFQSVTMNLLVFAGASQLAAVNLMSGHAAGTVVVLTGLVINLRFLLYSAALSPVVQRSPLLVKLFCAYSLTDQNYAVMSAHQDRLKTNAEAVRFYLGASICMMLAWHSSVVAGYAFGNLAPAAWSLDFAVPLSFVALVVPTLKRRAYLGVALCSSAVSLPLHALPYRTGLIATAAISIALARWLIARRPASSRPGGAAA